MDKEAKPHADTALDPESLDDPPTSNQYYLYSRIDGEQTVDELCRTSGLGRQVTLEALEALQRLGLIEIPGFESDSQSEGKANDAGASDSAQSAKGSSSGRDERSAESAEAFEQSDSLNESTAPLGDAAEEGAPDEADDRQRARGVTVETEQGTSDSKGSGGASGEPDFSRLPKGPDQIEVEPELLEMDVDLDVAFRRELVALSRQLDDITYYEFYGVEPDADVGAIKKAYFQLSKRYHPDKHFGGELGPFEEMLEEVFQHITRAYRILTDEARRNEYDDNLGGTTSTAAGPQEDDQRDDDAKVAEEKQQKQQAASRLLVNRARKYRNRGDIDRAAAEYRKAVSLNRNLETALEAAEMLVEVNERLDDAAVFARAALKLDEEAAEGYYLLGRSYEGRDLSDEAVEAYRKAVEIEGHQTAKERLEGLESKE